MPNDEGIKGLPSLSFNSINHSTKTSIPVKLPSSSLHLNMRISSIPLVLAAMAILVVGAPVGDEAKFDDVEKRCVVIQY